MNLKHVKNGFNVKVRLAWTQPYLSLFPSPVAYTRLDSHENYYCSYIFNILKNVTIMLCILVLTGKILKRTFVKPNIVLTFIYVKVYFCCYILAYTKLQKEKIYKTIYQYFYTSRHILRQ